MEGWGTLAQLLLLLSQDHLSQDRNSKSRNIKPRGTQTTNISEIWGIAAGKRPKKQGLCLPGSGSSLSSITTQLSDLGKIPHHSLPGLPPLYREKVRQGSLIVYQL